MWFFRRSADCPVDATWKAWLDASWERLRERFGREACATRPMVLPTPVFFPEPYDESDEAARRMVGHVQSAMGLGERTIRVQFVDYDNPKDPMPPHMATETTQADPEFFAEQYGGDEVTLLLFDDLREDPLGLVVRAATELAHVYLFEDRWLDDALETRTSLADLVAVYFGMGVFVANAAIRVHSYLNKDDEVWHVSQAGTLSQEAFGYALALFAREKEDPSSAESDRAHEKRVQSWEQHMQVDIRAYFRQSRRFLRA